MPMHVSEYASTTVADVMTQGPLSLNPSDTVSQADEIMAANRIRQIPIIGEKRRLVGIITDRDIRSFLGGSSLKGPREDAFNTKIADVMTTEPMTVSPEDSLEEVVELLIEEKIGGIPVVDEAEGLVGIITYVDVLRCFLDRLQED